ncbi:MAG TPA: hypothetical protein VF898_04825 [Chloroflexota bacterium]
MIRGKRLEVSSTDTFREWLQANHEVEPELWLVFYKKAVGKPGPDLTGAIETALCFGWIDGKIRSIDSERYAIRFTPRRKGSNWSETNRKAAARLLREGRLSPAGLAALPPDLQVQ